MYKPSHLRKDALKISILLSVISVLATLIINFLIGQEYSKSTGKTRALFGFQELSDYSFQYYVVLIGVSALIFALTGTSQSRNRKILAIIFSIFAIILVFLNVWKLFIQ